ILLLVGHGFPIWLRFIGGKGLSPVGGFTAALLPYSALIAIAVSGLAWLKTRKFMPTTVTVIILTIALAPIFEYQLEKMLIPIGLFILVGLKRKIDEPRTREIEGTNDWPKLSGDGS
ncbi:MAG: glycerol-3-phosphate acyltransferase, partial [Actinomycetota bacterium]|nr:glycerol-3-phosphate acyltransferase [Actinomycetota bacterium]